MRICFLYADMLQLFFSNILPPLSVGSRVGLKLPNGYLKQIHIVTPIPHKKTRPKQKSRHELCQNLCIIAYVVVLISMSLNLCLNSESKKVNMNRYKQIFSRLQGSAPPTIGLSLGFLVQTWLRNIAFHQKV